MEHGQELEKRPVADLMSNLNCLVDEFRAEGEVKFVFDLMKWKEVLTIHIPLPKRN